MANHGEGGGERASGDGPRIVDVMALLKATESSEATGLPEGSLD